MEKEKTIGLIGDAKTGQVIRSARTGNTISLIGDPQTPEFIAPLPGVDTLAAAVMLIHNVEIKGSKMWYKGYKSRKKHPSHSRRNAFKK